MTVVQRPREVVRLLALAVDAKGDYFPGHSEGVAYVVQLMAAEAGLGGTHLADIQLAAFLHDVGKLIVPDEILNAPRKLTNAEYDVMKTHTRAGARIARGMVGIEHVAPWVEHHHEHFDGSGYPDGLVGEDIPAQARMLLVADAFHVMTSDRPYRRALTRIEAIAELEACAGSQFCPTMVKLFTGGAANRVALPVPA